MPRYIIRPTPRSPKHARLVRRLVNELQSPGSDPQPLILEQEVPATGSRHVHVIRDQWKKLPDEERSDVIVEAYSQAEGQPYAEQITLATGLTPPEALALGMLPWQVVPGGRADDTSVDVSRAMAEEARHTVLGSKSRNGLSLRYARKEDAAEALKRLRQRVPSGSWMIVQDAYSDG